MIRLKKIQASNYKAYKELNIEISRYNVLIGKNSAGKSAITRLIPFVISSLNLEDGNIFDMSPLGIDIGATYSDIVHGHSEFTKIELGADFEVDGQCVGFTTEIAYSTELKELFASKFIIRLESEEIYKAEIDLDFLDKENAIRYCNDNIGVNFVFNGLIPKVSDKNISSSEVVNNTFSLLTKIKYNNFNLSYLGPFRSELKRTYTARTMRNYDIGINGNNAPYIFREKEFKSNGVLSNKIKEWMQHHFNGKYFKVKTYEKSFSIYCTCSDNETNIIDEGMGFAQIFPSIINRSVRDFDKISGIEIIEQPELHMHPAACGVIADLYLDAIKSNIVFLETHSKELLLRVRRRVAEGLSKNDINILYVNSDIGNGCSTVQQISLNEKGAVAWWPKGIFEEDFDEIIALSKAGAKL